MIFKLITKASNNSLKQKSDNIHENFELLRIKKRQIFHKNIPDLLEVRIITGEKFNVLQEIFNRFDPINTEKLKDNPNKYELLTKTVIYKLPTKQNKEAISDLVDLELSLWFNYTYCDFKCKNELIETLSEFKKAHLHPDPFERQPD